MFILPNFAQAENTSLETKYFSKIQILHNGRIKPMETFAKAIVKPITGSNKHATETLIKMLFNPAKTEHTPLFKISHSDTIRFLKLEPRKKKRYSYLEIAQSLVAQEKAVQSILNAPPAQLTSAQKELSHLYEQTVIMRDVLGSLLPFTPIMNITWDNIPSDLTPQNTDIITYIDIHNTIKKIHTTAQKISQKKGAAIDLYTPQEKEIAILSFALFEIEKPIIYSTTFKTINNLSPWDIIRDNKKHSNAFNLWKKATIAYHSGDWDTWNATIEDIYQHPPSTPALHVEVLYNQLQPFYLSAILYIIALLLLVIHYFSKYVLSHLAFSALSIGASVHLIGLGMRSYILQRPPVSTLYESILFVGFIAILYGLISFYKNRQNTVSLIISSALGFTLYLLAYFNDQSGDTLLMLPAVLNTNFWLTTHVLVITAGYGFCLITSGLAHYALIKPSDEITPTLKKAALWSLLLCTLGTILGGVWADQSWGRFWGWDPKENGALLIVLWLIWVFHAKLSKQISETIFHAGLAYLSVIVMLSWFGVNLLSIGLHAYGFTDSALYWLIGFIIVQTTLLIVLVKPSNKR